MKKNEDLYKLFIDELEDMMSCENQILETLPEMSKLASSKALKEALAMHVKETETQILRLSAIFSILGLPVKEKRCKGMAGILAEGKEMVKERTRNSILDATIISAAQKVEHYEIASYGTLRSFAKHLDLDKKIADLLQETLDEEGSADKKLTKLAEGGIFTDGINEEAAERSK